MPRLKALTDAIAFVEQNPDAFCEDGVGFGLPVGHWEVKVAFDGFASVTDLKTGVERHGKIPKRLMPRVAKLLPGLPPPRPVYDDEPF